MRHHLFCRFTVLISFTILLCFCVAGRSNAQTATYHLHKEASSTSGLDQLKTAGPDGTTASLLTSNLQNAAVGEYVIQGFDTQSGVPNAAGVIPSGSTVTFTLWMNKTANVGTMYPRAKLLLNSSSGTPLCTATGTTAVSTTLKKLAISCTTSANITMTASDRFYLWTGINLTTGSSTSAFQGNLNIEGSLNGNYDSQIVVPLPLPAPAITNLSPASGPVGASVTITGTTFGATQGSSAVTFNGVSATPSSWSATSIIAPVPAGATTGPVSVTVNGQVSNAVNFTVTPKINSLSPTLGGVGTSVIINGSTFGATQGSSTVTFNGVATTPTSWSASSIAAPVPAGAATGPVVVTVNGQASNGVSFTVTPKIDSLSPNYGATGSLVTINGSNFGATQGTSTVKFNGTSATVTSWSATSIAATVPTNATTGPVVVTVNSQASNGVTFTVTAKITSISPTSGSAGTSVTINGSLFGSTQGTSTVTFNGTAATPTSWSASRVIAPVPVAGTTGPIVVTVNGFPSNGVTFTAVPHINSVSPTSGPGGTTVTISGNTFGATQGSSTVTFNGAQATATSWSPTGIAVLVPAQATTGSVIVTVNGTASNAVSFSTVPRIDSLTPASGPVGTPVTITGTTFGPTQGTSTVKFNGVTASPTSWSATSIVAPAPTGVTNGPVTVTVGGTVSNGVTFTLVTNGNISGRVTDAVTAAAIPNATVKLSQGSTTIANTTSNANGDYSFSDLTPGNYAIEVSSSGYGTRRIGLVTVSGGGNTTANVNLDRIVNGPVSYIYDLVGRLISTVGPTDTVIYKYDAVGNLLSISHQSSGQVSIIQFSPASGPIGATVTIDGTGFSAIANQNTVTLNGVTAAVSSATSTQIVATVPAGATTGPIGVTSPNGSATSAANFTVTDGSGGPPTISSFTPTVGAAGDSVTVSGTNFETTPTDNKLRFSGKSAAVASATTTSIVGSVPSAASGHITVSTPAGTATSTTDFFIPPPGNSAASIEVTGRMNLPGSQVVTINGAGKKAMILFDGVAGQRMSLNPTNNNIGQSTLSIYTPNGNLLTSRGMFTWSNNFFEPMNLPATGTYTIFIDTNTYYTGSMTISLYLVPPDITGTITPGGPAVPVSITTPGQNANLTFSGNAGQKITLIWNGVTIPGGTVSILKPDGSNLYGLPVNTGEWIDDVGLPLTGTYTIVLDPAGGNTGNATFTLYDSSDVVLPIVPGGDPVTVTTTSPGQKARLTFDGTAGQLVSVKVTNSSYLGWGISVTVNNPDGSWLTNFGLGANSASGYKDVFTLPVSGTYTMWVDPNYLGTGSAVFTLYNVPADFTSSITPGGPAVTTNVSVPGQNARLTFTGSAGQRLALSTANINVSASGRIPVAILKPDGSTLIFTDNNFFSTSGWLDNIVLPVAGDYTIFINPNDDMTGTIDWTLYDDPDVTATITPGGPPVTSTTTIPGQNIRLTFDGTAGQKVSLRVDNVTIPSSSLCLYKPDGTTLASAFVNNNGVFLDTQTLPANGTYAIGLDPGWQYTGSATFTLYDDPDVTSTVVVAGDPVHVANTVPGQNIRITFDGTTGQQVTVHVRNNNLWNVIVSLVAPNGTTLASGWTIGTNLDLSTQTLPADGTYTIVIDPFEATVGGMDINVTNP